ncbi:uncharacterized protein LOC123556117 [Mercenaria mercenaria]|uniref:uncharacterized protein LOC123556117 n=1 Tax=Mercenaria mercenaria TaxID=6596 RepID=UPI00234F2CDD|nr:uncharacterized protein LOC123556117 [Mercenaria mercenaria]
MLPENRKTSRKYCCICKGIYRGKVVDGKTISLHRFPQNKRLKRVWIQRCKTVMRTFKWNENKLLCSEHFVESRGPTFLHTLPSIFPTQNGVKKIFPTSNLCENEPVPESDEENTVEDEGVANYYFATKLEESCPSTVNADSYSLFQGVEHSELEVSLHFHDYCKEPAPSAYFMRNMETQTYPDTSTKTTETQSLPIKSFSTVGTQTECETKESGQQTDLPLLAYEDVMTSNSKLIFYTGIPDRNTFDAIFDEIKEDANEKTSTQSSGYSCSFGGRPRTLRLIDEFFMTLMRLRLGLLVEDLANRFCISSTACGRVLNTWIDYLDSKLDFLIMWPSSATVKHNMPKVFRDKFPDTRVIIDCSEIRTETPSSLQLKSLLYSDYKSHITWKSLVGISPSGHVTYVSDLWVGSISDKQLTKQSGILELCQQGDAIMADKGFTIADLTTPKGIKLIIPPFRRSNTKFSKREVQNTRDIANARIHVERQMERIKNFRIVQGVMPITMAKCGNFVQN